MELPRQKRKEKDSATIPQSLWLILGCCGLFALTAYASDPAWWSTPGPDGTPSAVMAEQVVTNAGIVTTNYVPNGDAAVTESQIKQFTARAVDDFNYEEPLGAGTNLNYLGRLGSRWKGLCILARSRATGIPVYVCWELSISPFDGISQLRDADRRGGSSPNQNLLLRDRKRFHA
jgi:hypothetical protein